MASTYSDLKIELIGTGEQTGTWGTTTNNNFSIAIGEAITGSADVAFSSADVTVTLTDTNAAQTARNLRLNLTGTSGGARNLILGSGCQIEKLYLINNGLADAVTVKNTSGTGIAVPAGKSMFVYNNGTNVVDAITHLSSLSVSGATTFTAGTASTSTTTGTAVITGGLGVSGRINAANFDGIVGANTAAAGNFTTLGATGVATFSAGTVSAPAITTTGDTNTGIFFPAADTIAFTEGGVESMRIDSSGNVGIGSTTPGSFGKLVVKTSSTSEAAGLAVMSSTNDSFLTIYNSGSVHNIGATYSSTGSYQPIAFVTSGSERMRIDSSGNVGIGTSSPATKAEISGTAASANIALRITNTDASGYSTLQMGDGNAGIYRNGSSQSGYAGTSSLNLITVGAHNIGFSTQNTLRAIIDSSGNVGIGTSSPSAKLNVIGGNIRLDNNQGVEWAGGNNYIYGNETTDFIVIATNGNEAMRINSSGRVGIGTSSPAYQLTVAGYSNANAANKFAIGSIADYQALFYYENGNETFTIENTSDYASSAIIFRTNNTERMRITSGGDVRIGTTDITNGGFSFEAGYNGAGKSAALFGHITGTGSGNQYCIFYYDGTSIGSITQNGTTAVAYNTTSDYRLKENIAPMTNALAKVAQLKPVTYTWKADGSDGQGFIAHELQAVVPDAVTGEKDAVDKNGKPTYQGVDTSYLVATLTAAIQEQQALIENLTTRLNALKGN